MLRQVIYTWLMHMSSNQLFNLRMCAETEIELFFRHMNLLAIVSSVFFFWIQKTILCMKCVAYNWNHRKWFDCDTIIWCIWHFYHIFIEIILAVVFQWLDPARIKCENFENSTIFLCFIWLEMSFEQTAKCPRVSARSRIFNMDITACYCLASFLISIHLCRIHVYEHFVHFYCCWLHFFCRFSFYPFWLLLLDFHSALHAILPDWGLYISDCWLIVFSLFWFSLYCKSASQIYRQMAKRYMPLHCLLLQELHGQRKFDVFNGATALSAYLLNLKIKNANWRW